MKRASGLTLALAFLFLHPLTGALSPAWADGPGHVTKGQDVSTVGTGPYTGPTPAEVAKLTAVLAAPAVAPAPEKASAFATMTISEVVTLTDAEKAKLEAILSLPSTQAPVTMTKLEPMVVPTVGTPDLTPQERAKRAAELTHQVPAAPKSATGSAR
jgi:hypothetical protein